MKFEHNNPMKIILEKINLVQGLVTTVVPESKEILLDNNAKIAYDKLVLATGSKPNKWMARTRFTGRNGSLSQAGFRSFRALGTYHKTCCNSGWRFNWYRAG
jgi:NADPH-dependent 2,4-dienoyl-CoA reductase/sulfur reductase-like enzyme